VAIEQPKARPIGHSAAAALSADEARDLQDLCVDQLLDENKRLREIVIYLSGIIIRDAVNRK
jgi:hypothetical protein